MYSTARVRLRAMLHFLTGFSGTLSKASLELYQKRIGSHVVSNITPQSTFPVCNALLKTFCMFCTFSTQVHCSLHTHQDSTLGCNTLLENFEQKFIAALIHCAQPRARKGCNVFTRTVQVQMPIKPEHKMPHSPENRNECRL